MGKGSDVLKGWRGRVKAGRGRRPTTQPGRQAGTFVTARGAVQKYHRICFFFLAEGDAEDCKSKIVKLNFKNIKTTHTSENRSV